MQWTTLSNTSFASLGLFRIHSLIRTRFFWKSAKTSMSGIPRGLSSPTEVAEASCFLRRAPAVPAAA